MLLSPVSLMKCAEISQINKQNNNNNNNNNNNQVFGDILSLPLKIECLRKDNYVEWTPVVIFNPFHCIHPTPNQIKWK